MKQIYGRGGDSGGEESRTAVEAKDTLRSKSYVKVIDLLGEGEFDEVCIGGARGLYLDDVPVANADGSINYSGLTFETRSGTLAQPQLSIGGTIESVENVGVALLYNAPIERSISAEEADLVRVNIRIPALTQTNTSNGDIGGTSVAYKIEYKSADSPTWTTVTLGTGSSANVSLAANISTTGLLTNYTTYSYGFVVSPTSTSTTRTEDYDTFVTTTISPTTYTLQKSVDGGAWETVVTGKATPQYTSSMAHPDDPPILTTTPFSGTVSVGALASTLRLRLITSNNTVGESYISYVRGVYRAGDGTFTIQGKSSSEYEKQNTFPLTGTAPWLVRVTRLTADSTSSYLNNKTFFASITTVLNEKLRYPGSVLVGMQVDAEQFSSVPERSYLCRCLKVKIPNNYDPYARSYTEAWDGGFVVAWTDNPAWCFYDILTNTRYGLGERIPESAIDEWELYSIAQYCDELVLNDDGIYEPRFTCNVVIQTREEAYQVIKDFASIFRGISYWGLGTVVPVQDSPKDVTYSFNNTSVADGVFTYQSSSVTTRFNAVSVTWNNPKDRYKRWVEYVEDVDAINDLGYVNETSIAAFGCTSRAMARRIGKWLIYTNNYQTDIVSFVTGAEGCCPRPGDVIQISDTLRSGERRGGRIKSATLNGAILDNEMSFSGGVVYTLSAINTSGVNADVTYSPTDNVVTNIITFDTPLSQLLAEDSIFIIADNNIEPQLFKVISAVEKDNQYEINALEHDPSKYDYIEKYEALTGQVGVGSLTNPVVGVVCDENLYTDGVSVKSRADISWPSPRFASAYIVSIVRPDNTIVNEKVFVAEYQLLDVTPGEYKISITAINILGQQAQPYTETVILYGKTKQPATVPSFSLNAVGSDGYLAWDTHPDLDVVVGGFIIITHTTKTSGATWADGVFVTQVPGASTSTFVPLLGGTYMAKALDSSGFYSMEAAFAASDYALLQQKNYVEVLQESPDFSGVKTNMYKVGAALALTPSLLIDDAGMIDSYSSFDYLGDGVSTSGEYAFSNVIDLGAQYKVNIAGSISAQSTDIFGTIDERINLIDEWSLFDSDLADSFIVKIYLSTTNDDTTASPVWSAWEELRISSYSARGFRFKLEVHSLSESYNVYVNELSVSVDVDDRTVGGNDLTCPTTGLDITFTPSFMGVPAVSIAINDMIEGDYYDISSKTEGGVSFTVKNSGVAVERVIDYIAKGFGYKY